MPSETRAAVVIIDGDGPCREKTDRLLSRQGYRVYATGSVTEGIERIGDSRAELALVDFHTLGTELPLLARELKTRFPTTLLAVSAPRDEVRSLARLAGELSVELYSVPSDGAELVERLEELVRIRELEQSNRRLQLEQELLLLQLETCHQDFHQLIREKTESLQRTRTEIAQSEKLAAVGYLAAGMAHDIRNPLNSISLFTQLMRQNSCDPDQEEYLGRIIREIEKIDAIIRKLLDMSQRSRGVTSDVRVDQVIDGALEVFSPQFEAGKIRLERRYELVPPPIKADAAELGQAFTNLFLNALDEMSGGGRLGVGVSVEEGMVVVRVEDSGAGIPDDALPRIFDPFFTTKPLGTGMGLPVVRRIARLYGGTVSVERSGSEGTVIRLDFPVCREAERAAV